MLRIEVIKGLKDIDNKKVQQDMTMEVSGRRMVQARSLREVSQGTDRPEHQEDYLCEYLNYQELSGAMLKEVSDN